MKLASIINYCTYDYDFIKSCIEHVVPFSSQIIVPVSDHFFDKIPEESKLLEKTFLENKNSGAIFIKYRFDINTTKPSRHWHNFSRYIGFLELNDDIDYVLFLDADEIIDTKRFIEWLEARKYFDFDALRFAAYWYFRAPQFQATTFEDPTALVKKSFLNRELLMNATEERNSFNNFVDHNRTAEMHFGLDSNPMVHHYSWVRTKEQMLRKIKSWGHNKDRNWELLVKEEFEHPFTGTDFVHGYDFKIIKPFCEFNPLTSSEISSRNTNSIKQSYKKPLTIETKNEEDLLIQAEYKIEKRNYQNTEMIFNNILYENNMSVDALNNLEVVYLMQKEYLKVLKYINRVLNIDSKNQTAITNLVNLKEKVDDLKKIREEEVAANKTGYDASVIIPVFNQSSFTEKCLDKIFENTLSKISFEVIVVDNASEDNTPQVVESFKERFPEIKYIRNEQNLKFAKACNIGAREAKGEFLIFLNNDTEVQKGWLENAIMRLEMDDNIGIVGAKLLYPDRTIQHCGIIFVRSYDKEIPVWPIHRFRGVDENYPGVLQPKKMYAVTGACMFIRKELFISLNGFNENYGMYFEDIDLCFKAAQLGKSILYEPNCVVIHHEGKSGTSREDIDKLNDQASKVFYKKWSNQIIKLLKNDVEREIFWIAPFFNPSGYASEAINFALGLDKYIHLTTRNQNPLISDEFINNIPDHWRKTLLRLHRIEPHKWLDDFSYLSNSIFIHHQPGNNLDRFKNSAYCIGRTMYETDRIPLSWVDKCNQMDEIWVPSKFNISTFSKSGVDKSKLVVIPGSIDTDIFDPDKVDILELPNRAKFNFLSIFEWTNRKGWDILLNSYFKSFTKDDNVCLYLRTFLLSNYDVDTKKLIQNKINSFIDKVGYNKEELPRIELLTKQLSFNDMIKLYKSVDAFVLPSRGEGWGRPYMEAMSMELPVIGTNWSGNKEFMTNENSYLIDIEGLVKIKENEINSYIGHKWAQPSEKHLIKILRQIYQNPQEAKKKGIKARQDIVKNFNLDSVAKIIVDRLNKIDEKIKLDELNKISSAKKISNSNISIIWEGAQFVNSSLALVNRELCTSIVKANFKLSLIKTESDQFKPSPKSSYNNLLGKERANNENTDLHVRHHWPPNLKAPEQGHWIVIQPWEFGSLPQDWVKVFSKSVDEMWVPSNYVRQVYIDSGVHCDRVFVVPNGFDPKVFNPNVKPYSLPSKKKFKFLFVGGTIYRKGIDLLLHAYCEVFTNDDDVSLIIKDMGGNSFYKGQNFKDLIFDLKNKKGTPDIIYIDKELNEKEIAGLYTACDVLVHPFRGEGFGLPILEAMASGVPAIVTSGGSAADFCNRENSLLINSKKECLREKRIGEYQTVDYPWILQPSLDDLKEKILFAYKNPDAMKALGQKAFTSVSQKWTWESAFKILQNRIFEISSKPILRENNNDEELDADKQLEIAENYISENKLNDARLILENILEYKPNKIDALNNLSVIEILESNFEAALKLIEKITDQDPANKIAKSNLEYIETELCKTNVAK